MHRQQKRNKNDILRLSRRLRSEIQEQAFIHFQDVVILIRRLGSRIMFLHPIAITHPSTMASQLLPACFSLFSVPICSISSSYLRVCRHYTSPHSPAQNAISSPAGRVPRLTGRRLCHASRPSLSRVTSVRHARDRTIDSAARFLAGRLHLSLLESRLALRRDCVRPLDDRRRGRRARRDGTRSRDGDVGMGPLPVTKAWLEGA